MLGFRVAEAPGTVSESSWALSASTELRWLSGRSSAWGCQACESETSMQTEPKKGPRAFRKQGSRPSDPLGPIQLLDEALMAHTVQRALGSPRLRMNHNFHPSDLSNPHRFLNALVRGTYCPPHRHSDPPKSETFLVLKGEVAVFLFDGSGSVIAHHLLGRDGLWGIDISPGHWHSIASVSETAVCFEVKPGPWEPANDKEFPAWAPHEGDPRSVQYLEQLLGTLG